MTKKIKFKGKINYSCEICGLVYRNRDDAEKCQNWCNKNNSCNLIIARNALNRGEI